MQQIGNVRSGVDDEVVHFLEFPANFVAAPNESWCCFVDSESFSDFVLSQELGD
jgi:hypothetical protein